MVGCVQVCQEAVHSLLLVPLLLLYTRRSSISTDHHAHMPSVLTYAEPTHLRHTCADLIAAVCELGDRGISTRHHRCSAAVGDGRASLAL
jgi:hypothetical protein